MQEILAPLIYRKSPICLLLSVGSRAVRKLPQEYKQEYNSIKIRRCDKATPYSIYICEEFNFQLYNNQYF